MSSHSNNQSRQSLLDMSTGQSDEGDTSVEISSILVNLGPVNLALRTNQDKTNNKSRSFCDETKLDSD